MVLKFLNIRFLQIKRSLQDLTFLHTIFLVLIVVFFGLGLLSKIGEKDIWSIILVISVSIFLIQISRPDKRLISIITELPFKIYSAEYLTFLVPIFITLLVLGKIFVALILILIVLCIALINKKISNSRGISIFSNLLPKSAFEWRAGMRKMGLVVVFFYILAIAFSGIRVAPFLCLFFALTIISQFFYSCEPLSIICLFNGNARQFLFKKILESLKIYSIITLPIIILAMWLVPDLWFLGPIFYILASVNIANFILIKYVFFHPNSNTGGGGILASLSLLGCIIPFFAPMPLMVIGYYFFKAHKNLSYYLND